MTNGKAVSATTIAQLVKQAQAQLAPLGDAKRQAGFLMEAISGVAAPLCHACQQVATPQQAKDFAQLVARRCSGEPLQYVLGLWEFYSLPFAVGPGVLIPRPETELLVDKALALLPQNAPLLLADLCTGSGCIAIALAKHRPHAQVWAIEKSPQAAAYLTKNIALNNLQNVLPLLGDALLPPAAFTPNSFALIASNPPYITAQAMAQLQPEVQHEPPMALAGGDDGLDFYHAIPQLYRPFLQPGGHLLLEIGYDQGPAVQRILQNAGYQHTQIIPDLGGCHRLVLGQKPLD